MMSFDSQTFVHRKALLQLGDLLSDDDSKKIVFVGGLPKALEETSAWEILAHLEVQGKATVKELTRILKAINRHDAAKKAKDLIGKLYRRKKDPECKALKLEDSLQLAEKQCKILVEQVDYLKFAANKDGNKRIEEVASEAMECLVSQVQHRLRHASGLFRSRSESAADDCSAESSSSASSPESSPSGSPVARPHAIHSHITSKELKKAAEKLKGNQPHPNPHVIHRCITGGELKKAAEKLKGSQPIPNPHAINRNITGGELKKAAENLKGTSPHPNPHTIHRCITGGELKKAAEILKGSAPHPNPHAIHRCITGYELKKATEMLKGSQPSPNPHAIHRCITGGELKRAAEMLKKPMPQKGSSSQVLPQILNDAGMPCQQIQDAPRFNHTFHQARDEEEDPYTLPGDPDREDDEDPYTLPGPFKVTAQQNTTPTYENIPSGGYTAERPTDDVSSTDDYSSSTYSYTGDSGFSDIWAFLKKQPSEHAHCQKEQGSDISSSAC